MQIAVVTKAPQDAGNFGFSTDIYQCVDQPDEDNGWRGTYHRLPAEYLLTLRTPVFQVGEILILDETGREYAYPQRKPDKWDVQVTTVDNLEEAAALSRKVMDPEEAQGR